MSTTQCKRSSTPQPLLRLLLGAAPALLLIGACGGGDPTPEDTPTASDGTPTMTPDGPTPTPTMTPDGPTPTPTMTPDGPTPTPTATAPSYIPPDALLVSANTADLENDVVLRLSPDLGSEVAAFDQIGDVSSVESLAINGDGDGVLTYDRVDGSGGILILEEIEGLDDDGVAGEPVATGLRTIAGPNTGLVAPKGLVTDGSSIIVADFGAKNIKVFNSDDAGNIPPTLVVDDLGGERSIWDVAYDGLTDTLWAAGTDGVVLVYENFLSVTGDRAPSDTLTPTDGTGTKISVNLHGIAYTGLSGALILSDVGDAGVADDGQLFVIELVTLASGDTEVDARVRGPSTLLGNPVDIAFDGNDVYVAEKSNSRILRFDNLLSQDGEDNNAPDLQIEVANAESVASIGGLSAGIYASSNPGDRSLDRILSLDPDLSEVRAIRKVSGAISSLESVKIGGDGHGYMTVDSTSGSGGILVQESLRDDETGFALGMGDRLVRGSNTGIVSPKGIELLQNYVLIADVGAGDIKGFALTASGNTDPDFVVSDLGGRSVWDIEYDPTADRLFAAGTDGVVIVFDDFAAERGVSGPDRTITPVDGSGTKISVNLHGIDYIDDMDVLILSDVGLASDGSDGQLFMLSGVDVADGNLAVDYRLHGPQSLLGNPVDLDFDGRHLYVAEKAGGFMLRYDDFLSRSGDEDASPSATRSVPGAESVDLIFDVDTDN